MAENPFGFMIDIIVSILLILSSMVLLEHGHPIFAITAMLLSLVAWWRGVSGYTHPLNRWRDPMA